MKCHKHSQEGMGLNSQRDYSIQPCCIPIVKHAGNFANEHIHYTHRYSISPNQLTAL